MHRPLLILALAGTACGGADAGPAVLCTPAGTQCNPAADSTCLAVPAEEVQAALGTELPDPDLAHLMPDPDGADYACNEHAEPTPIPAGDVMVSGPVRDYFTDVHLAGATVNVYADTALVRPIATAETGMDGTYQMVIPVAELHSGRVFWLTSAADHLPTYELFDPLLPDDTLHFDSERLSVAEETAQMLATVLGTSRPPGTVVIVGRVRDCRRRYVAGAVARVYGEGCGEDPIGGVEEFFFEQEDPVQREFERATSLDGLFAMLKLQPADSAEVRITGRLGPTETVVSRAVIPLIADSVVITDFDPLEQPFE
jgi:hypothetical protein